LRLLLFREMARPVPCGEPTKLEAPMAVVILFGLISSTVLNMVVVPSVYYRLARPANSAA
jgi:multidrug efflux pump subunit AcrB